MIKKLDREGGDERGIRPTRHILRMGEHSFLCYLLYSIGIAVLLAACIPGRTIVQGKKIDKQTWQTIIEGKTTEADVIALLGEPQMRKVNSDETKTYKYTFQETKISSSGIFRMVPRTESYTEDYEIVFDRKGIVLTIAPPKDNP